jgi:hypothetical protein
MFFFNFIIYVRGGHSENSFRVSKKTLAAPLKVGSICSYWATNTSDTNSINAMLDFIHEVLWVSEVYTYKGEEAWVLPR